MRVFCIKIFSKSRDLYKIFFYWIPFLLFHLFTSAFKAYWKRVRYRSMKCVFLKFIVSRFLLSLNLKELRTWIIFVFLCFLVLLLFYLSQHRVGENVLQFWTKYCKQIYKVKQNRFFYGMFYGWKFAIFLHNLKLVFSVTIKPKYLRDFLDIS